VSDQVVKFDGLLSRHLVCDNSLPPDVSTKSNLCHVCLECDAVTKRVTKPLMCSFVVIRNDVIFSLSS